MSKYYSRHYLSFFIITLLFSFTESSAEETAYMEMFSFCGWISDLGYSCTDAYVGEPISLFLTYDPNVVDVSWDYDGGVFDENNNTLSYAEPGLYNISVTGGTLEDPPRFANDNQLIAIHEVIPPEMITRIEIVSADGKNLSHRIWYDITNYGSPAFDNGGRYGSGLLACSAVIDYGDGSAVYSDNYAAADSGYLENWLTNEDTFLHEYAVAGEYRLTVSASCEFTGTPLAPVDGPTAMMTRDIIVGDDLIVVDFEDSVVAEYPSYSLQNFEFSPSYNEAVMVYDDADTHSISSSWGDTMVLRKNDGNPFNLQSFKYKGRWPGISSRVEITGIKSDGTEVYEQLEYDGADWNIKLLNWNDLIQVGFYTPAGRLQMDNFVFLDQVQPATLFDFESEINGDYDSLVVSEYHFMPLRNTHISIFQSDNNQSVSPIWEDTLRLTRTNGGVFDLMSFDFNGYWSSVTGNVTVIGLHMDGSRSTDSFDFSSADWSSRDLNWTDLIQVDFISSNGRVMLDNIAVSDNELFQSETINPQSL